MLGDRRNLLTRIVSDGKLIIQYKFFEKFFFINSIISLGSNKINHSNFQAESEDPEIGIYFFINAMFYLSFP